MLAEWPSNLWLCVELLIISVVVWWLVDLVTSEYRESCVPMGLDTEHVYHIATETRNEESDGYIADIDFTEDRDGLMARLRALPEVKAVAMGSSSAYNYNFWGQPWHVEEIRPDSVNYFSGRCNRFNVSSDYPLVFNIYGINGETPGQLRDVLAAGKVIATRNMNNHANAYIAESELMNLRILDTEERHYTIGALIRPIKRGRTEHPTHATVMVPMDPEDNYSIYLRVKPEYERDFARDLMRRAANEIDGSNIYISDINSMEKIGNDLHRDDTIKTRYLYTTMIFLLVSVFLGLLGTFWFRTQTRVRELAIRMSFGATRAQIFRRLMGEGLILLAVITPVAIAIDYMMMKHDLAASAQYYMFYGIEPWWQFVAECAGVAALLALTIAAGIYFPARKAMNVEPADVLRSE